MEELDEKKDLKKKQSNIDKVRSILNGDNRLPPIPPTKAFKGSKKDKEDKPKHKKKISCED